MTVKALMPVHVNLVAPLPDPGTATRITETGARQGVLWSDAVDEPIGASLRPGDLQSATPRRTRATTPSSRTSPTATATGTTRTTSFGSVPSADSPPFSMLDLVTAEEDCRRTKRTSAAVQNYEEDIEHNLCRLRDRLLDGRYTPGRSRCFVVLHPKPREVWAANFEDRVVHHLPYNRIGRRFEAAFIANSSACIAGRGTMYAAERLEHDVRSITRNWDRPAFYLKADLANFFVSIHKPTLQQLLHARVHEPFWRALADTVLMHDPRTDYQVHGDPRLLERVPAHKRLVNAPAERGLPIGNLSSQFFANVLLNELDQFVKHRLKARYYGRYVDDLYLLHESPQWLNDAAARIDEFLRDRLGCQLNPRKTILQPVARGIDFVGQEVRPWRRITRRRTVQRMLARLETLAPEQVWATANSYLGLVRQASHSRHDQAAIARAALKRGHAVDGDMTKVFRKKAA
jgi:RNA-directed DNA polymerase